ncbi:MAG: AAA family ATPase [Parvularculaceae bacterium]|nr:AAA family ATPase [Parvularculaceae bacterium]
MYEEYFGFSGSPFRLAPDPKFFFGSKSHNKAMAYLHYGLRQAEGFIVISGEIGAGKSILIAHLLDQLDSSNVVAATLSTPHLTADKLLSRFLPAHRIKPSGSGDAAEIEAFEDFLFDQLNHGRRVLLIVDEAQNLPLKTLEELRVLSNLEYEGTPLLQVFLVGQPDFRDTMARADMEQLRQRVIATYHLAPMSRDETEKYVEHRLGCVGWKGDPAISADAYDAIFAATGGLPRKIHKLCNRVLLFCSVEKLNAADGSVIATVLSDMSAEQAENASSGAAAVEEVGAPPVVAVSETTTADAPPATVPDEASEGGPAMTDESPVAPPPTIASAPPKTADAASEDSVFDRLRARRKIASAASFDEDGPIEPPKAATLDDVANAIAAARAEKTAAPANDDEEIDVEPPAPAAEAGTLYDETLEAAEGWKKSVVMSINDTRDELRRAHQSVVKLRKQLTEIDKRRRRRRVQIAESLDRAESLLAEFQNAWR